MTASPCDISGEGEGQPDEIPEEAAPNSNSNDEEWWPKEVDLNAAIDSKPVETDGRQGWYREITVDSSAHFSDFRLDLCDSEPIVSPKKKTGQESDGFVRRLGFRRTCGAACSDSFRAK